MHLAILNQREAERKARCQGEEDGKASVVLEPDKKPENGWWAECH